jgi:hypothetical protein
VDPATDPVTAVLARIPVDGPVPPLPDPAARVRLREEFGWTVTQMGKATSVRRETVWTWESDPPRTPRGEKGQLYARLLAYFADELARAAATSGATAPVPVPVPVPDAVPPPQPAAAAEEEHAPPVRLRHRGPARTRLAGHRPEPRPRQHGGAGRVPRVRRARLRDLPARGRHPPLCPLRQADVMPRRRPAPATSTSRPWPPWACPAAARSPLPRPSPSCRPQPRRPPPCPLPSHRLPPPRRTPHPRPPHRQSRFRLLLPRLPFVRRPCRAARAPPPVRPPAARRRRSRP